MTRDADILIVGGGLNGPVLAVALAQAGFSVIVVDDAPAGAHASANFDGRAYALALTSQRLLDNLGLWSGLGPDAQPMLDIKVTEGHAGHGPAPFWMHFDHREIDAGPLGYMVEDRFLRPALHSAMDETPGVTHLAGCRVIDQQVSTDAVSVTLADGRTFRAGLLAGCDGRGSGTASRADIGRTGWAYGQTALVCAIAHDKPGNGVAHQFFMPQGPLAILPLRHNRSSIVWTDTDANALAFNALSDDDYLSVLRPRFGDFLGDIRLDGARFTYPLGLSLAHSFVAPRVALVGDAAHGLHPIAGQGLNAGLRDIAALVQVLTEARRRGEDISASDVLNRYAAWRRFDTAALAMATDGFNRLFSNDQGWLAPLRNIGMGAVSALPFLRRGFMREAAGLSGELPDLMRG